MADTPDDLDALRALIREALQELHDATPEQIDNLRTILGEYLGPTPGVGDISAPIPQWLPADWSRFTRPGSGAAWPTRTSREDGGQQ